MFSSEGSMDYARVVAKTWIDPQFREKLIADPRGALGEHGIEVPNDMDISVHPGAVMSRLELALPDKPDMDEEVLGRYHAATKSQQTLGGDVAQSQKTDIGYSSKTDKGNVARTQKTGGGDVARTQKTDGGAKGTKKTK